MDEAAADLRVRWWCEPGAWTAPVAIALAALLVRPAGAFPISDDFDYSATVGDLLRTGEVRLSDWPSMTLVGQVYWAAGFAKALGFSELTLRVSTLVLHAFGCMAAYAWLRGRGTSQATAAFAAVVIATSPETFYFACTFQTDVPGLAWMLITLAAAARSATGTSRAALATGIIGAIGYSFRQTAAIPLIAAVMVDLGRRRWSPAFLLAAPLVAAAAGHQVWLRQHGIPHHATIPMLTPEALVRDDVLLDRLARVAATVGLYAAPAAALWLSAAARRRWSASARVAALLTLGSAAAAAAFFPQQFKAYDEGTVFDCGIGADSSLDRTGVLDGPGLVLGGRAISLLHLLTAAAAAASLAVAAAVATEGRWHAEPAVWHLRLSMVGAIMFALISGSFYERYFIPIWSLAILGLALRAPRPSLFAWGVLALWSLLGVAGTQDYFVRFGTAWQALEDLRASGISTPAIDGGMEFAGAYLFNPHYRDRADRVRPFLSALPEQQRIDFISAMVVNPYDEYRLRLPYAVTYQPLSDEQVLRKYDYSSWLRRGSVYAVRRTGR